MNTDKFISSTEVPVRKTEARKIMRSKSLITHVSARMFILFLLSVFAAAQYLQQQATRTFRREPKEPGRQLGMDRQNDESDPLRTCQFA